MNVRKQLHTFPRKKNPNCEAAYSEDHLLLLRWKRLLRNVCDFCIWWTGRGHLSQGTSCRRDFQGEQILFLSFCTSDLPSLMFWEWGGPGCSCSSHSPHELLQVHGLSPSQAQLLLQSCSCTWKEDLEKLQVIVLLAGLARLAGQDLKAVSGYGSAIWIAYSVIYCKELLLSLNIFSSLLEISFSYVSVFNCARNLKVYRTYFSCKN